MIIELFILFFLVLFLWTLEINRRRNTKNLPPGPLELPILGNLVQLGFKIFQKIPPYHFYKEFAERYGPLVGIQFGKSFMVVIDDPDLLKEVLCSEVWSDRYFDVLYGGRSFNRPYGLLFSSGEEWKEMRRFTLRTLRDFGYGKNKGQDLVLEEELKDLMTGLDSRIDHGNGKLVINMEQFFTISVLNILWFLMAGKRFSYDDEKLLNIQLLTAKTLQAMPIGGDLANAFPSQTVRDLYFNFVPLGKMINKFIHEVEDFFQSILDERRAIGFYKDDQRDFIDVFLKEIDNHKSSQGNAINNYYSDQQFITLAADMFLAGSETTSNTLEFAFLYLILNPMVQLKLQEEIDRVVGPNRLPSYALDRPQMPYTEATLLEIQRMSNVVPIDNRNTNKDSTLGGYFIPKGSVGILNIHSVHFNKKLWGDPCVFRPERFLDSENNIINSHNVMAFGLGKRVCVGEPMAKASLFTYLTTLLQKYTFARVPNNPLPTSDARPGFTLSPHPYDVLISYR